MALGCRVTAAARPATTPTTQAVRRASAAPMCDGASGMCTCVSVHVMRAPQGGRAVVPAAAAGGSALAGGWTCVRVCRAAVAAHRVAARGGQTLAAHVGADIRRKSLRARGDYDPEAHAVVHIYLLVRRYINV